MKRRYFVLLGLVAALGAAYVVLLRMKDGPTTCAFRLEPAQLRELAASLPGERPTEVRFERLAHFAFPEAVVYTGGPLAMTKMVVYAYQLVWSDGSTVIIDTAMSEGQSRDAHGEDYDTAAWAREQQALHRAKGIYVTHEHVDHLGGLLAEVEQLPSLDAVHLTSQQLAHPENTKPASLPPAAAAKLQPFVLEGARAVAPGVVLIEARGHTPGSLLVYIQLADGRELVLTGDTAWHRENISEETGPPRLVSLLLHNDRDANACQLRSLHALSKTAPDIAVVPGHDARVVDELERNGLLVAKFR